MPKRTPPMTAAATKVPPIKLSGRAQELFDSVSAEYSLDDIATGILRCACEALMRAEQAAAIVAEEGLTYRTRLGEPRQHPAAKIEYEARQACAASLQKLSLNLES